jgi:programmed cell death 6-interacting protein
VGFAWSDTLRSGAAPSTQYSWAYEKACVLFQLAAVETLLTTNVDRSTQEGIETVKTGLVAAAGLLLHLRDGPASQLVGAIPLDLRPDGLTLYINLLLAEAQVCYYEAAKGKGMSPQALSKVAGSAADLYRAAAASGLQGPDKADADRIFPWTSHCESWAALFDAAAFYRYSEHLLVEAGKTGQGYGQRISWLTAAESACAASVSIPTQRAEAYAAAQGNSSKAKAAALAAAARVDVSSAKVLLDEVRGVRAEAEKDNDRIYFQHPPKLADLPALPRAQLAKPAAVPAELGRPDWGAVTDGPGGAAVPSSRATDLFAGIVPAEVAASLAVLSERLAALSRTAQERNRKLTEDARSELAGLGIAGILSSSASGGAAPAGLPESVWARVARCQVQGGVGELERLRSANAHAAAVTADTLRQAEAALGEEADADATHRAMYGGGGGSGGGGGGGGSGRWLTTPSDVVTAEVRGELGKYKHLLDAALSSDAQVLAKLEANRPLFGGLMRSRLELDAAIPAGAPLTASGDESASLLASLKENATGLEALLEQREKLVHSLRDGIDRSAVASILKTLPQSEHGVALDRVLAAPSPAQRALDENIAAQARALDTLRTLAGRFAQVRALDERTRARERSIQSVTDSLDKYEEVTSNLREGEGFWAELKGRSTVLAQQCRDLLAARTLQRREVVLGSHAAQQQQQQQYPQQHQQYPQQQQQAAPMQMGYPSQPQPQQQGGPYAAAPFGGFGGAGPTGGMQLQRSVSAGVIPIAPVAAPGWNQQGQAPWSGPAAPAIAPLPLGGLPPYSTATGGQGSPHPTPAQAQLLGMGFSRDRVDRALALHRGEFESALNQLLTEDGGGASPYAGGR